MKAGSAIFYPARAVANRHDPRCVSGIGAEAVPARRRGRAPRPDDPRL